MTDFFSVIKINYKKYQVFFNITILLILCLGLFFSGLGGYLLIDVDEPRYAEAAREMLVSGDWITPYYNYELRFDKPVFIYWLIAFSYKIYGINEFAARFPSAVSALLTVLFVYFTGKKFISNSFGFIAGVIMATSLEFIAISRMAMTDMVLSFFIIVTLLCGFWASNSIEKYKKNLFWYFAYAFSGFAILTKGPVGFVLPAIILGIYLILIGQLKQNLRLSLIIPGFLIMSLISTPWYFLIIQKHGMSFVHWFFIKHNFSRFSGVNFEQHKQFFGFYYVVLFAGLFPWFFYFILPFLYKLKEFLITGYKKLRNNKNMSLALFENFDNKNRLILFSFVWIVTVFLFFDMANAKLLTYILPLFPATAFISSLFFTEREYCSKSYFSIFISIITGLIFIFISIFHRDFIIRFSGFDIYNLSFCVFVSLMVLFSSLVIYFAFRKKFFNVFLLIALNMVTLTVYSYVNVVPKILVNMQGEYITVFKQLSRLDKPKSVTAIYGKLRTSPAFYYGGKVEFVEIFNYNEIENFFSLNNKDVFVLVKNNDINDLTENLKEKFYIIRQGKTFSLISNKQKI